MKRGLQRLQPIIYDALNFDNLGLSAFIKTHGDYSLLITSDENTSMLVGYKEKLMQNINFY